jgi:hypothetical protein
MGENIRIIKKNTEAVLVAGEETGKKVKPSRYRPGVAQRVPGS